MNSTPKSSTSTPEVRVGQGAFCYGVEVGWGQLPRGWNLVEVAGVATDSAGNVFVFNRGQYPLVIFDRQGRFLRAWVDLSLTRPHGITIGPDDAVYLVDDGGHTVRKFTAAGRRVWTLGTNGRPSETGATSVDYRTIECSAGPFNYPTNMALSPGGEVYVADGYGNARVHRFSASGQLIASWGEPGSGQGQFHVPHGIGVDAGGTVYVADRENSRVQLFSPEGTFLTEWTDVARPCQVTIDPQQNIFVAELGFRAGMFPGNQSPPGTSTGGRVSVFNTAGELLARWGGGDNPCAPGDFFAPHDIVVDPFGDLYVGEVTMSAGGNQGMVPSDCHCLQKFTRLDPRGTP